MIRKLLKENGIIMTDREFSEIMGAVTQDIKFNQIGFKKRTSIYDVIILSARCYVTFQR